MKDVETESDFLEA